ncbi:Alb1-domain-containing protein [Hypoxylon sp. FL1284]|nr:Alb1-domain-containing protein [Hypoxylon sp. FL1284]
MAKGGIAKKKKAPSAHSRAARRATSPSIDTDKSLKNVQPPAESVDHRPSILSIHHGAGVSKKVKKGRNMSSKARKRFEKGQDRAAAIMERTEQKVAKSKGQARTIQSRRKAWDEINHQIPTNKEKAQEEANDEDRASELDEDMDDAQAQAQAERAFEETDNIPLQHTMEDEADDIL